MAQRLITCTCPGIDTFRIAVAKHPVKGDTIRVEQTLLSGEILHEAGFDDNEDPVAVVYFTVDKVIHSVHLGSKSTVTYMLTIEKVKK